VVCTEFHDSVVCTEFHEYVLTNPSSVRHAQSHKRWMCVVIKLPDSGNCSSGQSSERIRTISSSSSSSSSTSGGIAASGNRKHELIDAILWVKDLC
jgi:hypothetical protein